jgi:hypothetical protein
VLNTDGAVASVRERSLTSMAVRRAIMPPLGLTAGAIGRGRSSSPSTDGGRSSSPMTDGGGNSSPRTGGGGSPSYYAGVPSDSIDRAAGMGRPVGGGRSHGATGMPGGSDGGRSGGAAGMPGGGDAPPIAMA